MLRDDRAASSVLAVVLMMGFVAAASVSLFVVGSATLSESTQQSQDAQVQSTFQELNKDVSSVAFGNQKYRETNFNIKSNTAAFRQDNTGNIKVIKGDQTIVNQSVGSLVYEDGGQTIAYQAGGLWMNKGKDSRLMSSPPVEYQNGSLTFPIPALEGDESVRAGKLSIKKLGTEAPINNESFIEGELVTIKIKSEYYMGWAEYFRTQTNDVAVSVDHSPAGDMGIVTVKLGKPVANGNFEDGVMATGGDVYMSSGSPHVDGPVSATGDIEDPDGDISGDTTENVDSDLYELDEAIDRKVEETKADANDPSVTDVQTVDLSSGGTLVGGTTYYADSGFTLNGQTIDVDLTGGNVTLVIEGDMTMINDGDINVNAVGDHSFKIYTTGHLAMKNSEAGPAWSESAEYFQVYGTSEMLVALNGGDDTQFVGTIYAPRDEPALDPSGEGGETNPIALTGNDKCDGWDTCITTGSSNVKGAIVAGPTKFGQNGGLTHDNTLDAVEPTLELEDGVLPPPITYLKVAVHKVAVNNSDANRIAPAGDIGSPASVQAPSWETLVQSSGSVFVEPAIQVPAVSRSF